MLSTPPVATKGALNLKKGHFGIFWVGFPYYATFWGDLGWGRYKLPRPSMETSHVVLQGETSHVVLNPPETEIQWYHQWHLGYLLRVCGFGHDSGVSSKSDLKYTAFSNTERDFENMHLVGIVTQFWVMIIQNDEETLEV